MPSLIPRREGVRVPSYVIKGRSCGLDLRSRVVRLSPVAASRQMAKMHAPANTQTSAPTMTVTIKASPFG